MKKIRTICFLIGTLCVIMFCCCNVSYAKNVGLKQENGKYCYYNKKGSMVSGFKKISGVLYYFKKSSGKSYAITNTTKKYKGKTYYFSGKGKGFLSVGNKIGNETVAKVFDNCELRIL